MIECGIRLNKDAYVACCYDRAIIDSTATETKVRVAGLVKGKPYKFRVAAVNQAGPGQYAVTKDFIKPAPPPSKSQFVIFLILPAHCINGIS